MNALQGLVREPLLGSDDDWFLAELWNAQCWINSITPASALSGWQSVEASASQMGLRWPKRGTQPMQNSSDDTSAPTVREPSEAGLEAAADMLYRIGLRHGWWGFAIPSWRDLDPIGKDEFLDVVAVTVRAYEQHS